MRVLVVEDEKKLAGFMRKGLEEQGFAVTVSHDGNEAYTLACTEPRSIGVARRIRRRRRLWRDTASLRQALTRCVCRMEGARAPGIEHRT